MNRRGQQQAHRKEFDGSHKVEAALIKHVYQQGLIGQVTSLFCATILLLGLYQPDNDNMLLIGWYSFTLVIAVLRSIAVRVYSRDKFFHLHLQRWKMLFIGGAFLGGIGWGLAGSVLFAHSSGMHQTLIILVVAGVTAGAAPLLSAIVYASLAFILPALLPLIIQLSLSRYDNLYSLFDLGVIAYLLYLLAISVKTHQMISHAIQLQFENDLLLKNLSRAKNQLELSNKKLAVAAMHDPLTGIANRTLFQEHFDEAIEWAEKNNQILALLYIDLDNFKFVNDAYGHHVGDELMIKFVKLIKFSIRDSDFIARLGGDELAVLLENLNSVEAITTVATHICHAINKTIEVEQHKISISASIGISLYPADGETAEVLLKKADKAMYYIKSHGRNNFYFAAKLTGEESLVDKSV